MPKQNEEIGFKTLVLGLAFLIVVLAIAIMWQLLRGEPLMQAVHDVYSLDHLAEYIGGYLILVLVFSLLIGLTEL